MDITNQPMELKLTSHLRPRPSYPAGTWHPRKWQQTYDLEELQQIWFLPVWFWPDFWAASPAEKGPDREDSRTPISPPLLGSGGWGSGQASPTNPGKAASAIGQWLTIEISPPGALPLVELQGQGRLAPPDEHLTSPHPVTTAISITEGALRLEGASIRLPAGLPGHLAITHQPLAPGNPNYQINLALHHPEHGPFFEFQGLFRLSQGKYPGWVGQLQADASLRQVLELL